MTVLLHIGWQGAASKEPTGVWLPQDVYVYVWCIEHRARGAYLSIVCIYSAFLTYFQDNLFSHFCSHLDCGPFTAYKAVPAGTSGASDD